MELIEKLIPILVQPASTSRDNEFYRYRKRSLKFPEKFETKSLQAAAAKTNDEKGRVQQNIIAPHQQVIELVESRFNLNKAFAEILDIPSAISGDTASDEGFYAESRDPQHKPLTREKVAEKLTNLTKSTIESCGVDVSTTPHFSKAYMNLLYALIY